MKNDTLSQIYSDHHKTNRERGFTVLAEERGEIIRTIVGTGKRVLDIGCRDGALTKNFVDGNKILGVDIDPISLGEAQRLGIETLIVDLNGDWSEISERKFDVVVAGEVLEHLYLPHKVCEKVVGRLEDGGIFIGTVPNAFTLKHRLRYLFGSKRYTPLSDPTHINQFHIEELRGLLKKHFRDVEIRGLGRYKALATWLPGLFGFDLLWICRK